MNCHLLLVFVFCLNTSSVWAYHAFLREILHPFMVCADEYDIPRDKSLTGNLNNDIDTLRLGFDKITNCIESKQAVLRRSDDTADWYIGYAFDISSARELKHNLTESRPYNFTCLNEDSDHYRRDVCLNSSYVALNKTKELAETYNFSEANIHSILCNGGVFMQPGNCMATVGDECTAGIGAFLQHVLFQILAGKHCASTSTTPLTSPQPPFTRRTPSYEYNIEDTAFFACGGEIFNSLLEELFPPSEYSVSASPNLTVAKQSMQIFCSKHREYAQCVTQRIKGRNNMIDHLTNNVISVQNLEQALDLYCKNQDLILSQYQCVFNAVSGGSCYGGVYDLLAAGARNLMRMTSAEVCSELKTAASCRLNTQLNQCSSQFGSVMKEFYNNILRDQCYAAQSPMTDTPRCFANYSLGLQERMSGNVDVMATITKEMDYICENEIEGMTDCMYGIFSSPKKPLDVFVSKLFAVRNIKPLAKRICGLIPALKPKLTCVAMNFGALAQQPNNCLTAFQDTVVSAIKNSTHMLSDVDQMAALMCRLIRSFKPCLLSVLSPCDQSLGNSVGALYDDILASCNNPNYRLKETYDGDGRSSSAILSQPLHFIIVPFVLAYL